MHGYRLRTRFALASFVLAVTAGNALAVTPALVSPGKVAAFANTIAGQWSLQDPVASVSILRAKRRSTLLMQATVGTSGADSNPVSFAALVYVEDEETGTVVIPPQAATGQTCPAFSSGYCTLSITAFLDLDDPTYASFVNKELEIELFAYVTSGGGGASTANATLAVQLLRK